jgi:plastocyanin
MPSFIRPAELQDMLRNANWRDDFMARTDRPAYRRVLISTLAAIAVFASLGIVLAARTPVAKATLTGARAATVTSTRITILPVACSGGGTSFCFKPESANAAVGTPVVWTNMTGIGHTVSSCTSSACPGAPPNTGTNTFSKPIGSGIGSTASFTFTSPGIYIYYCMIHGYVAMHGKITVFAAPRISSFAPTSGPVATTVTITGLNLSHARRVTFNGTVAVISSDSATKIVTRVPTGASTGRIAVTTPGGTATSATVFTVT